MEVKGAASAELFLGGSRVRKLGPATVTATTVVGTVPPLWLLLSVYHWLSLNGPEQRLANTAQAPG